MYLDFEDYRPETPRIGSAISIREGVLLSLVIHAAMVLFLLFGAEALFAPSETTVARVEPTPQEPLRYVEVLPLRERPPETPRLADVESDQDRRAATRERAPIPENTRPQSRGNTPELVQGGPPEPRQPPGPPDPEPEPPTPAPEPPPQQAEGLNAPVPPPPPQPSRPLRGGTGNAFEDLGRYLAPDNLENPNGGQAEQSADIQFDSRGIDFGPWLRRFKNQVERNWIVPPAAMSLRGRVVIQFYVLRNGTIVDLRVVQPASVPALTSAALSALKLSNPTAPLPPDYPVDRVLFTVTFHYNDPPY